VARSEDSLLVELGSLRDALIWANVRTSVPATRSAIRALSRLRDAVARPVRIAVMGEENSGKSLLINYLIKHQVLPSGSFAGESTQLLIRHAPEASVHAVGADGSRNRLTSKAFGRLIKPDMRVPDPNAGVIYDAARPERRASYAALISAGLSGGPATARQVPMKLIEVGLPLDFLRRVEIIEVRGFPTGQASAASANAFRQVDLAIWCTLSTQAWKETEVAAWKRIPPGRRKLALMLVTYKDAIRRAADETRITARLRQATSGLFDDVVLVSLHQALQSLLTSDEEAARALHHKSNVDSAENRITGMIEAWQRRRLQKAGRLLGHLAVCLGAPDGNTAGGRNQQLAERLGALAADFLNASPSISLTERAA
jgi:GTPase SAR1 family protein